MWQKCPICNGTGMVHVDLTVKYETCSTCQGKKIISELNGLPPNYENLEKPENTDFRDGNMESQQEYFGK